MAFATRLTPATAARWRGVGLWSDETFATVLARWVRATPDREALTDGTHRLSYRELAHGIDRMAARLRALGIGAGDVVTIQLPNWVEFAFVFFALERLGAVAVTVSVDFRSRELEYIMRFADSKMFVCCAEFRDFDHAAMAAELKPRLPALALVGLIRGAAREGMVSLDDVGAARGEPAGFVPVAMDADAVMRMAFTSGTTGNPKGVMHSHNTTLAAARILNGDLGLSSDDVMMAWLPLGLNWGYLTLIQSLLSGAKAVLLDRFAPAAALVFHRLAPYPEHVAFPQRHRLGDALRIDERPIGRSQILYHCGAVDERYTRVEARDVGVIEHERLSRMTSNRERFRADLHSSSRLSASDRHEVVPDGVGNGGIFGGSPGTDEDRRLEFVFVERSHFVLGLDGVAGDRITRSIRRPPSGEGLHDAADLDPVIASTTAATQPRPGHSGAWPDRRAEPERLLHLCRHAHV